MFESIEFTINPHFMLSDLKPFAIFVVIKRKHEGDTATYNRQVVLEHRCKRRRECL